MGGANRCGNCGRTLETAGGECPACALLLALGTSSEGDAPAATRPGRSKLSDGTRVGPYTIVRELGEGGMGVVYLAEQSEPLKRRVALKVIKHGMDTEQVVKRFEAERQALALMDHVAVARVFEAGETDDGRPYFAMEYIDGEPITAYCDRLQLDTAHRLQLFSKVCDGLQHAHQRGIIHRDIKPSNVLVTETDGEPLPKIIDFGVAKATERSLTEHSALTAMGVLLGTLEYMSPEQADLAPLVVDTRTDVYSLGVLLYELLTGALPFDMERLREAAFDEVRRQIREVRPSKPSTRISELGEKASSLALSRRADIASLRRRLAGDLDLIAMKALEKERDRRYGSPSELAADIRHHLANEPILARAPSLFYHARKTAARNRLASVLAVVIVLLAIGAVVVNFVQHSKTRSERDRAEREAQTAQQVSSFLQELFVVTDPHFARGREITLRDVLDRGAQRVEADLADQPQVQVRLMVLIGNIYRRLGMHDKAVPLLQRATETDGGPGIDPRLDVDRHDTLARAYRDAGRLQEALVSARLAAERATSLLAEDDPLIVTSLTNLGAIERDSGEFERARATLDRALELARKPRGEESAEEGWALLHLGWLEHQLGNGEAALEAYEQGCAILETSLQPGAPGVASCYSDYSNVLMSLDRLDEARTMQQRALEIRRHALPPDHPSLADAYTSIGSLFYRQEEYASAEEWYRKALDIQRKALGEDHPDVGGSIFNIGLLYRDSGRFQEAEESFLLGLSLMEAAHGPDHPKVVNSLFALTQLYERQARYEEVLPIYERAVASRERTHGPEHPWTAGALRSWAGALVSLGRYAEATPVLRRASAIADANFPPENSGRLRILLELVNCEARSGNRARAGELLDTIDTIPQRTGAKDVAAAYGAYLRAWIARADGRDDEADAALERALAIRRAFEPEPSENALYVEAILAANRGDRDRALERLGAAIDAGYRPQGIDLTVDFAAMASDPGLRRLLE